MTSPVHRLRLKHRATGLPDECETTRLVHRYQITSVSTNCMGMHARADGNQTYGHVYCGHMRRDRAWRQNLALWVNRPVPGGTRHTRATNAAKVVVADRGDQGNIPSPGRVCGVRSYYRCSQVGKESRVTCDGVLQGWVLSDPSTRRPTHAGGEATKVVLVSAAPWIVMGHAPA